MNTFFKYFTLFSVVFLLWSLIGWGFEDGTGWLLIGGSATVVGAGAWMSLKMREAGRQ